ncbi:tRNA (guanosine(46)-N7)-methyltransferase TrmB [Candidatus Symbiobacter mobilis]|uniref:tRNA (guanine-N(7)-)-methyltransferase n=1 Tax=Candidatus Symbiobacter mobilis CR TaxID=946483 RepID=U5NC06_9BURK|nr:tRNA (guanosine(46)-N7)-methyltransferase TrmB [Candidatus Symbiobacter mobilis]AGX87719.1 tRNA (guanine-N7-)-methyltransferase [Candidatus Symbiobacter mobilis CR]
MERNIRSFVRRLGRMTTAQTRALDTLGPRYVVPFCPHPVDPQGLFAESDNAAPLAPLVLEIGFGMGEATATIAQAMPETRFLCCDVHVPGVGALLGRIEALGLRNVRICVHDAVEVVGTMLPPACLDGVHLFFPDPWPKKRHHKRRLIQPTFVDTLVQRVRVGGYLHCATDIEDYAQQMLAVLQAHPQWHNTAIDLPGDTGCAPGFVPRPPYRPLTKFEQRGVRLGHGVWDLVFVRK